MFSKEEKHKTTVRNFVGGKERRLARREQNVDGYIAWEWPVVKCCEFVL